MWRRGFKAATSATSSERDSSMPSKVDSGLHDDDASLDDAWNGFSDESADEDQLWADRDEWHLWRNRVDEQVSGALGTATATAAMGRFARMQTKKSKGNRTDPLQFGKFKPTAKRSGTAPAHLNAGSVPQQQPAREPDAVQFIDPKRFDQVLGPAVAPQRRGDTARRRRRRKKPVLDPIAKHKKGQLRKLDAARWERRGDRTKFLAQYKKRPSYQDVLDARRRTGVGPKISKQDMVAAAHRLHKTQLMSQLVAKKVDPANCDPAHRQKQIASTTGPSKARVTRKKKGQQAALNFGVSVNILARKTQHAKARRKKQERLQQTISQTKFRRKKQQLSRRKWDEYNEACAQLRKDLVRKRYEEQAHRPNIVLPSPDRADAQRKAQEARAQFLHKGDKQGPFGPGPKASKGANTQRRAFIRQLEASEAVELRQEDADAAKAAQSNQRRFMPLPKSVTAYRSFGALGDAVVPPFGTASLPRDSERQVKLYDAMTGAKL
mgnify:CR=1 FL=1